MTQSARRASTSATRAPSSRRTFTPGNNLRPLTSVQPRHCYPDLHHGNEKSTAHPLSSDVDARQEEDDSPVNICLPLWLHAGHRTLRRDGVGEKKKKQQMWGIVPEGFFRCCVDRAANVQVREEGCGRITSVYGDSHGCTKDYKHPHPLESYSELQTVDAKKKKLHPEKGAWSLSPTP